MDFISLFAGAGGLDLGLELAGWDCRYACDKNGDAIKTQLANKGRTPLGGGRRFGQHAHIEVADVTKLTGTEILEKAGLKEGEAPLMAGGPPCQSWSSAGKQKGLDDPRGQLFRDFVRLASECGCKLILFENVRGMITARGPKGEPGGALKVIRKTLHARGFDSTLALLNAADFGVPQRRVRLFIVGYRGTGRPAFPSPTHEKDGVPPWTSMEEALQSAWPLAPDEYIRPSGKMAERLKGLQPGQGAKSAGAKETTRPGGHWGYLQGGFVADPRLAARTVTASSQQDWIKLDDGTFRRLTPNECALLQTFPAEFEFVGRRTSVYRQIGNAVPPELARHLGVALLAHARVDSSDEQVSLPLQLSPLPDSLVGYIRYTKKEERRNGASRRAAKAAKTSEGRAK